MNIVMTVAAVFGALIVIQLTVTLVNVLQKGGAYRGGTVDEILGVKASSASAADVEKLSKREMMQLFYAAPAPDFAMLNGEYQAKTLPVGIQAFSVDLFTHHFFGPGRWEGKAFLPERADRGRGYNIFNKNGNISRTRKMDTFIGPSTIDDRPSFHLDYRPHNGGVVRSMHDELRMINPDLFLGMGYMGIGGGSINPAPFLVFGKKGKFVP